MARRCDHCRERPATERYIGRKEKYREGLGDNERVVTRTYHDAYLCEDCAAVRGNIPQGVSPFPLRIPDGG